MFVQLILTLILECRFLNWVTTILLDCQTKFVDKIVAFYWCHSKNLPKMYKDIKDNFIKFFLEINNKENI